nr:immunoglobulin heavy chain junction region [Mus musculus]
CARLPFYDGYHMDYW